VWLMNSRLLQCSFKGSGQQLERKFLHDLVGDMVADGCTMAVVQECVVSYCMLLDCHCRCKQLMMLLLSTAVFSITRSLEAEPLLACVTAGMLLANRRCALLGGAGRGGGGGGGPLVLCLGHCLALNVCAICADVFACGTRFVCMRQAGCCVGMRVGCTYCSTGIQAYRLPSVVNASLEVLCCCWWPLTHWCRDSCSICS
jgi:hypothetical protein